MHPKKIGVKRKCGRYRRLEFNKNKYLLEDLNVRANLSLEGNLYLRKNYALKKWVKRKFALDTRFLFKRNKDI